MAYFIYNGELFEEGAPVISANNPGLRYGDGLFETMKVKEGVLLFSEEHFSRLWNGMAVLGFELPAYFTKGFLKEHVCDLIKTNNIDASARVRLSVIRGDGGLLNAINNAPVYIIQASALNADIGEWNSDGLLIGVYDEVKKSCDVLSNLKHNNYLPYIMGARHAARMHWNDTIILNSFGRIADTAIANIFIVKDKMISTPHLKEGCIAGIMRQALIGHLLTNNWKVSERELTVEDLRSADEVFLTNSIRNIKWVQRIGETVYNSTITQQIYRSFLPTIS